MSRIAPQTNYNQLVEQINGYIRARRDPSDFERRRLDREIEKVKRIDPAEGWLLAAMLAAISWDREAVVRNASNAIALRPRSVDVLLQSSHCYWLSGLFEDAARTAKRALELYPNSTEAVDTVIENAIFLGEYTSAIELIDAAQMLGIKAAREKAGLVKTLEGLRDAEVAEDRVHLESVMALNVMAEQRVRLHSVRFNPWRNPETMEFHFVSVFVFFGEVEQEIALEKALAERLIDDPEWDPNRLSSEFLSERPHA